MDESDDQRMKPDFFWSPFLKQIHNWNFETDMA